MQAITKPRWKSTKPALRDIDWENGPDRALTYNTYRITIIDSDDNDNHPAVRFHNTIILVSCGNGIYRLNSGGWRTATTKQRLNALLWNLGIHVYQHNFEWYVPTPEGKRLFEDNMTVIAKGWEGCY